MAHGQSPDEIAKSMGFPSAAAMSAWQQRQSQIQQLPAQTMSPQQKQQPAQAGTGHPWLDAILNYLPLAGAMHKAGNAMDGKK